MIIRTMPLFSRLVQSATAALIVMALLPGCGAKNAADKELQALCEKDGGIKVYETVTLPKSQFDESGMPRGKNWNAIDLPSKLDPDYCQSSWTGILKKGDPLKAEVQMWKSITRIRRQSDRKLLGEAVIYGRSGGDSFFHLILGGHPSGRSCPEGADNLLGKVFIVEK
jgi:hypothetical protein